MTKKLSIGIIGTRGIPNQYGGYEAAIQELAPRLAAKGHRVVVYCSPHQSFKKYLWKGVELVYQFNPEDKIGTVGQFIYDLNCNLHSRKQHFDVIFHMGYTSDSVWYWLWDKQAKHLSNMDGMEWLRSKYTPKVQTFLKKAEAWAAKNSDLLVADSTGVLNYLKTKYTAPMVYIAYGAEVPEVFQHTHLESYQLKPKKYDLIIARMEPENNIEMAIKAKLMTNNRSPLVIIGNQNTYAKALINKYKQYSQVQFHPANYRYEVLNSLRYYARYYIHGHSVGGTNPSLLEAMASQCKILAHDNEFNRGVLLNGGSYFNAAEQLKYYFEQESDSNLTLQQTETNIQRIHEEYHWDGICNQYEQACFKLIQPQDINTTI